MRWTMGARWLLLALCTACPLAAAADPVAEELERARRRLDRLEARLRDAGERLASTQARVDRLERRTAPSGVGGADDAAPPSPAFFERLEVRAWLAGSYLYSLEEPTDAPRGGLGGSLAGLNGRMLFLHPDHDSFAFDSLWLDVAHPVDADHRGGFALDAVYGKAAGFLSGVPDASFLIRQVYVQYLAPFGAGGSDTLLQLGVFATHIGTESPKPHWNYNITRSNLFALLEPAGHAGVRALGSLGEDRGIEWMLGLANGFSRDLPDRNDAKTLIGRLAWSGERASLAGNAVWGGEQRGADGAESGIANVVAEWRPRPRATAYVSLDYAWIDPGSRPGRPSALGVSAAGRVGLGARSRVALRAEYVADRDRFLAIQDERGVPRDAEIWGITATADHLLTDHLMLRGEVRYDWIRKDGGADGEFFRGDRDPLGLSDDQLVLGVEIVFASTPFGG